MRVLVVRLGSMGDVLHALPAVAALRAAHPDAEIGWAIERHWTPFLESGWPTLAGVARVGNSRSPQRPLVDYVHVVDTLGWRKAPFSDATWEEVLDVFRSMRALRYDVAIDFQGSIKSAIVAQLSGSSSRIGFATPREKPATMFYTSVVQPSGRHIIDQNLSLVSSVFPSCTFVSSVVNVFPSNTAAESELERKLATSDQRPATNFAILNPGAGWPAKQWPPERYAVVARALREEGIVSLVNYGPGEESLAREVEVASDGAARPISCTLCELISLTRRASLFIGGDTGPMHLAALLGIPTIALFGPTDPARNGPYSFEIENQKSEIRNEVGWPTLAGVASVGIDSIVLRHSASRTSFSHVSEADPGLLQITPADVITAARRLLSVAPPFRPGLAEGGDFPEDAR